MELKKEDLLAIQSVDQLTNFVAEKLNIAAPPMVAVHVLLREFEPKNVADVSAAVALVARTVKLPISYKFGANSQRLTIVEHERFAWECITHDYQDDWNRIAPVANLFTTLYPDTEGGSND